MRQLCLNAESDAMKLAIITVLDLTGVASCVSGSASQMTGGGLAVLAMSELTGVASCVCAVSDVTGVASYVFAVLDVTGVASYVSGCASAVGCV